MASYQCLRLILGDQLNELHPWYKEKDDKILYVMMECRSETDYAHHHIQKVVGFFLAMRHFARKLKERGHHLLYLKLDDEDNQQQIGENIRQLVGRYGIQQFEYQLPDEYRLDRELKQVCEGLPIPTSAVDTEHFLTRRADVAELFEGKKTFLMETFYREMRKRFNILMEDDGETPLTGRWNYDQENRKKLPKKQPIPEHLHIERDVSGLVELLQTQGVETIGGIDPARFDWPVTREESLKLLRHFAERRLPFFGKYQDAMTDRDFLLFHSRLSFAMNTKMLHPLEVIKTCIETWRRNDAIDIAQLEGYVRQIIGWREFMRGIYWAKMPEYAEKNFFNHRAPLPDWYWSGDTKMKCLAHAIGQSLDHAYAHHIQRLMVTGNFALLLGVHPDEVDAWYLGIYMDAIQWVELTNTRGMSQFADGGVVGTKPYVSSANYINKMSDYCTGCYYDKKAKTGERACPFNSLYWDFYDRHRQQLSNNPRVSMMYRVWDRMGSEQQEAILTRAAFVKEHVNDL